MQIGYAQVSTGTQTTDPQEDALQVAGCEKIFRDTISGTKVERTGLAAMLAQVRKGDVATVVRLDRFGPLPCRSNGDGEEVPSCRGWVPFVERGNQHDNAGRKAGVPHFRLPCRI